MNNGRLSIPLRKTQVLACGASLINGLRQVLPLNPAETKRIAPVGERVKYLERRRTHQDMRK
jgi:hypothetical protein